jgi:bisphosphoglycerate-independent phosphoglycerate mutase (AlkP superfamily)
VHRQRFFPKLEISYRVTTNREFMQTDDQLFGALDETGAAGKNDAVFDPGVIAVAESALVNRINTIIIDAFRQQNAADITIAGLQ